MCLRLEPRSPQDSRSRDGALAKDARLRARAVHDGRGDSDGSKAGVEREVGHLDQTPLNGRGARGRGGPVRIGTRCGKRHAQLARYVTHEPRVGVKTG